MDGGHGKQSRGESIERVDCKVLREYVEKEVRELEERLKILKSILVLLEECESLGLDVTGREFRNAQGRPIARIVERRDSLMLVFSKPVPEGLPYLKYALTMLSKFKSESSIEYSVEKTDKGITSILVTNVDKSIRDDVHAVLEFVANKIRELEE